MKPTLILITLLLAACSQKSANPTVRIATAGAGLQTFSLPITFAEALGYDKEEGVDVSIDTLPSMGKTMQALVGGSVDVAGMSYAQTLQVAAEGQLLRFFSP